MKLKNFSLLTLILMLAFTSCDKATPAGFWKSYKNNLLVKNISDQGPDGGYRAMYWKADAGATFNSNDFLGYAKKNGWTLVDSSAFNQNRTENWTYNNKSVFPLTSTGFSDTVLNNSELEHFPRWFGGQLEVYKFKTGWVTTEPGTGNSIDENGFVVINENKTKLAVYHLWGD